MRSARAIADQEFLLVSIWPAEVQQAPQWAYLPSRGVNQALALVYAHCQKVQQNVRAQQLTLYDKRAGARRAALCGGLLLSVDLKSAFGIQTPFELQLARTDLRSSSERADAASLQQPAGAGCRGSAL